LCHDANIHDDGRDINDLVEQHMFGPFFTLEDTHLIEHIFLEEFYASSHPSIPLVFHSIEEEKSCKLQFKSDSPIDVMVEVCSIYNETLWVTPMDI